MIEIEDIKDRESLKQWLTEWPKANGLDEDATRAVAVTIAHRAAMRVLPIWWQWSLTGSARMFDSTALPFLRSCLISGLAAKMPTPELKNAAAAAAAARASSPATAATAFVAATGAATAAAATTTSATIAAAANAAVAPAAVFWENIRSDCEQIARREDATASPLWLNKENSLEDSWREVVNKEKGPEWAFWIKWYEDALQGRPQNWKMLEKIALIDPEIWEAGAVAKRIGEIKLEYNKKAPAKSNARAIQKAVAMNLPVIPPQIEALVATIEAEIERLRGKNPEDDIEKNEVDRLRETFEAMRGALVGLSEKLPSDGKPSIKDAEDMEGLLTLYGNEFQKWPKNNAADIVDSSCRLVLIGLSAGVMTVFGAPVLAATAIAGIAFGGKKLVGVGKALKDVAAPGD